MAEKSSKPKTPEQIAGMFALKLVKGIGKAALLGVGVAAIGVINFFRDEKIAIGSTTRTAADGGLLPGHDPEAKARISPYHQFLNFLHESGTDYSSLPPLDMSPVTQLDEGLKGLSPGQEIIIVSERAPDIGLQNALIEVAGALTPKTPPRSPGAAHIAIADQATRLTDGF